MNVVLRADASIHIGSGHIMRCLVLAQALRAQGHSVSFASRPQAGDLVQFVRDKGFEVHELIKPTQCLIPSHSADYKAWLQVSYQQDAKSLLALVNNIDLLIVDHYALDHEWESIIQSKLDCKVFVIDDLNRKHNCDLVLDQNLWSNAKERYADLANAKLLIGPKYALLRPLFNKIRQSKIKKDEKIIVFFGGSDPTSECLKVVKALNKINYLPFKVKLITGKSNRDYEEIQSLSNIENIDVLKFIDDFEQELATSKYAIGASGVSNWERFCLNVPTTVVSVAENQMKLSEYLSDLGLIHYLGTSSETSVEVYLSEFLRLSNAWEQLTQTELLEVDGLGANRVIDEIGRLIL